MSARWSPAARDDLLAAVAWYAEQASPAVADRFLDAVDDAVSMLLDGRFDGPTVTLSTGEQVCVWSVGVYRLYYRRADGQLELVRIFHPKRRPIDR